MALLGAHEALVREPDDEELVNQNVLGFEVVVAEVESFEPQQAVHDLAQDDADGHLAEAGSLVELVEEFAVLDLLQLDLRLTLGLEVELGVLHGGPLRKRTDGDQVVVQSLLLHRHLGFEHLLFAFGHCHHLFLEQLDRSFSLGLLVCH